MPSTRLSAYCSKVIEAGWIAAVVLVPLYFDVFSSRVFEPDKLTLLRSIAVFMSAAWLVKVVEEVSHGRRVFRFSWRTPLVLPTLVLVVIYLFATLTSVTPFTSLWGSYQRLQGTYTTLAYIVVFFLILNEMHSREQLDRLITAAIITSVPISLYGLIQHYGIDPLPWGGDVTRRVASNMGNAIFIAAYEIMIFFLTLGRIVESFIAILTEEEANVADILRAAAYIFTALIQIITIWFSQSRGPWVGLMVGAFTFVLFGLLALRRAAPDKSATTWTDVLKALGGTAIMTTVVGFVALLAARRTWKWLWLSWVLLAVLVAGFLVLFNLPDTPLEALRNAPYIGRLGRVFQTESGTGKVRVLIWEGAVEMITPHEPLAFPTEDASQPFKSDKLNFLRPLIGYGPESMYVAYNPFYPSDLAHYERRNASPDRSHNETFDALVITGVIGLVGYMVLFGSIFYYGLKWMGWINNKRQRNIWLLLLLGGGAIGTVGLMAWQGVEFFGVGLPFGMAGGLVFYLVVYAIVFYQSPEETATVSEERVWDPLHQKRIKQAVKVYLGVLGIGLLSVIWTTLFASADRSSIVGQWALFALNLCIPILLLRALWGGSEGARLWILLSTGLSLLLFLFYLVAVVIAIVGDQASQVLPVPTLFAVVSVGLLIVVARLLLGARGKLPVRKQEPDVKSDVETPPDPATGWGSPQNLSKQILLVSLVSAIIAHFVEIHFGIAIAATRTYFWVYAALLVLVGTGMLEGAEVEAGVTEGTPTPADAAETSRQTRRKKRRRRRRSTAPRRRPRPARSGLPNWLGPVLASAFVLALIMGTLGFDFITNAGRVSVDASCDPQVGRMLNPCWSTQAWNIIKHDLTVLPARGSQRPQETSSLMTLGLLLLALLIGSVVTTSEMARRGLFKRRSEDWGWGALLLVTVAVLVTMIVLFSIADRHLQLGRLQASVDQTNPVGLIGGLLDVSMYLSSVLVAFYTFVFLLILTMGAALLVGRRLPQRWSTPWGLLAGIPLFIVALIIMNQTNLKVIRADVVYKQGEEWSRQKQWDIAIAHHKRALELAPNEDFYYLWAGSAYLEKSKSAPAENCIVTGEPDISGILSMSIAQTAQLCREDLLIAARTILLRARHVNPLNTDHTANLGRLHNQWASLSSAEEKAERTNQSIGYYNQATRLSPQNTLVWNELATVYLVQRGDLEKARETIQHSLELDDRYFQSYLIQGDLLLTEAQKLGNQLVTKEQELASAAEDQKVALKTQVDRARDEWEAKLGEAVASYERAIELSPKLMNVYTTVASVYEQIGRPEDAVATYNAAVEANPKSAEPYVGLAELYQRQNNPEAAVAAYRQAIQLRPNNTNYRLALVSLLESLERPNEALIEIQEAARLKPDDPVLRQNLALMYHRFQMFPEALAEAQAAAQLAPNDATAQLLIGDSSRMLNDLSTAAAAYEQALTIAPNLPNAWNVHLNLALIYQQTGQLESALNHAAAALQAAPENQKQQINDFVVQLEQQSSGTP